MHILFGITVAYILVGILVTCTCLCIEVVKAQIHDVDRWGFLRLVLVWPMLALAMLIDMFDYILRKGRK